MYCSGAVPVIAAKDAAGLKYKMEGEFTVEAFATFMTELQAGELEPFLKSGQLKNTKESIIFVEKITQIVYGRWAKMLINGSLSYPPPLCC